MKIIQLPDLHKLNEVFDYDAELGVLIWKWRFNIPPRARGWNTKHAGKAAGRRDKDGYLTVVVGGIQYKNSRIIFKMINGTDPSGLTDHADDDVRNNKSDNLRSATHSQNMGNTNGWQKKVLPVGVALRCDNKKWIAKIMVDGIFHHLGSFSSVAAASAAYREAAGQFRGEFARPE